MTWDRHDIKVRSTLVDAVTDKILDEIGHETTAKGMLNVLDSVYQRKTLLMRILAKKQLLNLKINDGEDAQEFFSSFEKHISALKDAGENISPEEKLHYLLMILPEKYGHIIDVLDAMPKVSQTVDYVKGKVLFDHCKSNDAQEFAIESAAMKVNVTRNFGKRGNAYVCHRCKKPGHFRKDCHR